MIANAVKRIWLRRGDYLGHIALLGSLAGFIACFFTPWYAWEIIIFFSLIGFARWYFLGVVGISIGYHRMLAHHLEKKAPFETSRIVRAIFIILAVMAFVGLPYVWTANHRPHHAHSDKHGDPHSPVYGFTGRFAKLRGFLDVQVGTFFKKSRTHIYSEWIPDLLRDPVVQFVERTSWIWAATSIALPVVLGGVITWFTLGTVWHGFLLGFLTFLASTFLMYQLINSVNSYSHMFGVQRFFTNDNSRNASGVIGWILCFFTGGETCQNSHHRFPWSARLVLPGDKGIDLGWHTLKLLRRCGLIRNLREPDLAQIVAVELPV